MLRVSCSVDNTETTLVIFQILLKNDEFSNFSKNGWFFKFWQKMMIFQLAAKIDDFSNFWRKKKRFFFFKFGKNWWFFIFGKNDDFFQFWPKMMIFQNFGQKLSILSKLKKIYSMEVSVVLVSCQCCDTGMTLVSFWCCQHYRNIGPSSPATHSVSMTEWKILILVTLYCR